MVSALPVARNMKHGTQDVVRSIDPLTEPALFRSYADLLQALVAARRNRRPRLNQSEVGARMGGLNQSTVSAWETGTNQMGVDECIAYAKAVDLELRIEILDPSAPRCRADELADIVSDLNDEQFARVVRLARVSNRASRDALYMVTQMLERAVDDHEE